MDLISCIGLDVGDGRASRLLTSKMGTSGPGLLPCIGGPQVNVPCIDVGDLSSPTLLPCIGGSQAPSECTIYRCGVPEGPWSNVMYRCGELQGHTD